MQRKWRHLVGGCLGDEVLEGRAELVQTPVEGLIAGQVGESRAPVVVRVIVDASLLVKVLHVAEKVHG